jgi:hypothetical protein
MLCTNWDKWAPHQRVRVSLSPVRFGSAWSGTSGQSAQPRDAAALHRTVRLHGITLTRSLLHRASYLHAAGYRFEPRPRYRPSRLWSMWGFPVPPRKCRSDTSDYTTTPSFHVPSSSLFTAIQPEPLEAWQVKQIAMYPKLLMEVLSQHLPKGLKKLMFVYCDL